RRVDMYPTEDGCSVLTVHGSAARVQVAAKRVDAIAYQLRDTGGADGRTMDQLRSDVALDLLAGKDFQHAKIIVQVTLPARAALGVDNTPGHLVGYGDIAAQQAVDLAYQADATWRRILTEPSTGRVRDVGRRRYSPPAALRDHLHATMPTCTGPGCVRPAQQCDLEHREPYPAGPTDEHNLHPACRSHHRGKTFGGWKIIKRGGILEWVSPCGFHYPHTPEPITHPEPAPPPF
ncbi:HNH endonuclease signature motif containing protein, partial [Actinophytocola sp.]|uniref:HNH endonuclease signature motif containing protein n=1 Tax=Actinophytocola sp. TaxID=1872138 RepID=UPI0025BAFED5